MDINETVGAGFPVQAPDRTQANEDFETFLQMLTTQIQNQDPLSPLDAEDFASQLAAFSMVEQQTRTNVNLEALIESFQSSKLENYPDLIGKTVIHEGQFQFFEDPVHLELSPAPDEIGLQLSILDNRGVEVTALPLSVGESSVTWDGTVLDDQLTLSGAYSAEVRRVSDGEVIETSVMSSSEVIEVRFDESNPQLLLADGSIITEDLIHGIRAGTSSN